MGTYVANRVDAGIDVVKCAVNAYVTPRLIFPTKRAAADKVFTNALVNYYKTKFNCLS